MSDIQILEQVDREVIQTHFKLRYNNNNYTFIDYIYKDTQTPVDAGEMSLVFDSSGNLVESDEIRDAFGMFADCSRLNRG